MSSPVRLLVRTILAITLTNLGSFVCSAQKSDLWQKIYGVPGRFDAIYSAKSTYDNGFVLGLAATVSSSSEYLTWLIKTDINGNVIWAKTLVNSVNMFILKSLSTDNQGNIVITGATEEFDSNGDAFLMKLNSCGDKEWCKYIRYYGSMNYGYRVKIRSDGQYALYTRYAAPSSYKSDRLWIIDTNGNVINDFYVIPPNTHPNIGGPLVEDFIITSDGGYLFSGHCYFPYDTLNPNMWRLQHFLIKFDSIGNEQWIRPQFLDSNQTGVLLCSTEMNEVFYSVGYDYLAFKANSSKSYISFPYNGKFSFTGNLIFQKILHPDTMFTGLYYIKNMENGTLIQTGKVTHDTVEEPPYYLGVFKTDTMFNILRYLENDTGSVTNECITPSIDGKFLITGYCPPMSTYTEVDGFAIKVNSNLEYDSLYSFPFVYDSLCPFPILTDTIDCDCDIITDFGEPIKEAERYRLQIYPNPASERVLIRVKDMAGENTSEGKRLVMYDLFGRRILEKDFEKETFLDISGTHSGIYILIVEQQGMVLAREKLIVF